MSEIVTPALPTEILEQILQHLRVHQSTLYACALINRSWYASAVPLLYHDPRITGKNFEAFVSSICPSRNAHIRRNGLAELVRVLNMSRLVHSSRKSLTARLLGRLKENIQTFVAPQATFGINCLASISKCHDLRILNLSFVSEAIPFSTLFRSIAPVKSLLCLYLPHAFVHDPALQNAPHFTTSPVTEYGYRYPPNLRTLHILGGLDEKAYFYLRCVPSTLRSLHITNCPHQNGFHINSFLTLLQDYTELHSLTLSPNIHSITNWQATLYHPIVPQMPHLRSLDVMCPQYLSTTLSLWESADSEASLEQAQLKFPKLQSLTIRAAPASDSGCSHRDRRERRGWAAWLDEIYSVLDTQLPCLRQVLIEEKLALTERTDDYRKQWWQDKADLDELLKALAREDVERGESVRCERKKKAGEDDGDLMNISEADAGVKLFTMEEV